MNVTRRAALGAIGAVALAGCGNGGRVAVGSKNFTEELLLGEMYAQVLEAHGIPVARRLNLGGTEIAMAALQRGAIDLYPEYTGTGLLTVLKRPPLADANAIYETVKAAYRKDYALQWLRPSPMNDSQALGTTGPIAARYRIRTLSDLSRAAPQLRLGAVPEFMHRPDALPGLQRVYGGFHFREVRLLDSGLKYHALLQGDVDVVVAFGTDGAVAADHVYLFEDDKHFWPAYHVAPVVRSSTLQAHPTIARELDRLAPFLTDAVMRDLNEQIDGPQKREFEDVAFDFLKGHHLV